MPYKIRKSFTFEAAHQLESSFTAACHECIHGHSYTVEMFLEADLLNEDGMVLDFGALKEFKDQVMEMWDHGLILHVNKREWIAPLIGAGVLKASKVSFLQHNPTAETMARILFYYLRDFLETKGVPPSRVRVTGIKVHETSTGWAEYMERA